MANSVKEPFDSPDWIFDLKLDGYPGIAVLLQKRMILGIILRDCLGAILRPSPLLSFRRLTATHWSDVVVDRKGKGKRCDARLSRFPAGQQPLRLFAITEPLVELSFLPADPQVKSADLFGARKHGRFALC